MCDRVRHRDCVITTWEEFVRELRQQFKPDHAKDEARGKLL